MLDFLTTQVQAFTHRDLFMCSAELWGQEKHVDDVWKMRDKAYEAVWGEPVARGQWPFGRTEIQQKVIKIRRKNP